MEGYVAMIFKSKMIDEPSYKAKLVFSFIGRGDAPVYQKRVEIRLFRYNLVMGKIPDTIRVDPTRKFVHNRIPIKNQGNGTMLLIFLTSPNSELQKIIPSSYEEIKSKFMNDLCESFSKVNKEFPQYSELVEDYLSHQRTEWKSYSDLKKGKALAERIVDCFTENEEFFKAFWIAIGEAVSKNINIKTIPDRLLRYINSLATRKIILMNSEDLIKVHKETKILTLELMPTDLLLNEYNTIRLSPIKVVGTQEGEIEIFKLFKWEEES
jgi:hypothetical protein